MAATKRRKKATARRSRRRASNTVYHRRRRTANPHHRRRATARRNTHHRAKHRSRNPFGISGAPSTIKAIGGILGGVAIAKAVPRFLPANMTASPWMAVFTTAISAWVGGWAATKFLGAEVGMWVYAGGIAQTGSIALNLVLPAVGSYVTMGDFVPGRFSIPQNPVGRPMLLQPPMTAAPRKASVNIGAFHGSRGAM